MTFDSVALYRVLIEFVDQQIIRVTLAQREKRRNILDQSLRHGHDFRSLCQFGADFGRQDHRQRWLPQPAAPAAGAAERRSIESSYGENGADRGELHNSLSAIRGETQPSRYKERRKFNTSCICERLSELNLRTTALASEPQLWLVEFRCEAGGAAVAVEAWA